MPIRTSGLWVQGTEEASSQKRVLPGRSEVHMTNLALPLRGELQNGPV